MKSFRLHELKWYIFACYLWLGMKTANTFEYKQPPPKPPKASDKRMVFFEAATYFMGVNDRKYEYNGEHPIRLETVRNDFWMDAYPVTNREFDEFVRESKFFRTDPEQKGYSYVFFTHAIRGAHIMKNMMRHTEPWWLPVMHARWHLPYGPGSKWNVGRRPDHPVVHVGLSDADAYCRWLNKRLPTEYEWEWAARRNNRSWFYPWGDHFRSNRMNLWQGMFPAEDMEMDGFAGLSPVDAYPPQTQMGMYDLLGNVWEWTTTPYYGTDKPKDAEWFILRGGSFVDSHDGEINHIARVTSKIGHPMDYTAENIGFRCVRPVIPPPSPPPPPPEPKVFKLADSWHFKQQKRDLRKSLAALRNQQKAFEDLQESEKISSHRVDL